MGCMRLGYIKTADVDSRGPLDNVQLDEMHQSGDSSADVTPLFKPGSAAASEVSVFIFEFVDLLFFTMF